MGEQYEFPVGTGTNETAVAAFNDKDSLEKLIKTMFEQMQATFIKVFNDRANETQAYSDGVGAMATIGAFEADELQKTVESKTNEFVQQLEKDHPGFLADRRVRKKIRNDIYRKMKFSLRMSPASSYKYVLSKDFETAMKCVKEYEMPGDMWVKLASA